MNRNKRSIVLLVGLLAILLVTVGLFGSPLFVNQAMAEDDTPPPDHSLFSQLAGPFEKPQDVTATCLQCHPNASTDVMATSHWTWLSEDPDTGEIIGKQNIVNNYCVAVGSNEPRCTSCHVGYGYTDNNFDFTNQNAVDCLACHSQEPTYKKFPAGSGNPWLGDEPKEFPGGSGKMWEKVDLALAAQNVASPTRLDCGACHFNGGGGDAVKHGDLDTTLANPTKELDVHMGTDSLNFDCVNCHLGEAHDVRGTLAVTRPEEERVLCADCHTGDHTPHQDSESGGALNMHAEYVACQTCHIPEFARGQATKMTWDWSTAGQKNEDGKPFTVADEASGKPAYDSKKGDFTWEANVVPDYIWWNGKVSSMVVGDVIDPSQIVPMNVMGGSQGDGKIYPVKRFTGVQGYDPNTNLMLVPNLFPNNADDTNAYWKGWDWNNAFASGMEYVGQEYSGEYDWIETEMFWIQNHMVAPKENALACESCHSAEGRLDFKALGYEAERAAILITFPPVAPTPEPTPEPTEEPTAEPTEVPPTEVPPTDVPEPTEAPAEVEAPAETPADESGDGLPTWVIIVGIVAIVAVFAFFIIKGNKK